jgi:hypothetical protein
VQCLLSVSKLLAHVECRVSYLYPNAQFMYSTVPPSCTQIFSSCRVQCLLRVTKLSVNVQCSVAYSTCRVQCVLSVSKLSVHVGCCVSYLYPISRHIFSAVSSTVPVSKLAVLYLQEATSSSCTISQYMQITSAASPPSSVTSKGGFHILQSSSYSQFPPLSQISRGDCFSPMDTCNLCLCRLPLHFSRRVPILALYVFLKICRDS